MNHSKSSGYSHHSAHIYDRILISWLHNIKICVQCLKISSQQYVTNVVNLLESRLSDSVPRIVSGRLGYVGDICVEFWYHMYGDEMGTLTMYKQEGPDYSPDLYDPRWTVSGNMGNRWIHEQLDETSALLVTRVGAIMKH